MSDANPIDLLFGGMDKLGPGSDCETRSVLQRLPARPFRLIVDAGCGTGRQSLVLASELGTVVHAVDCYQPFLDDLKRRSQARGIAPLIETHCMDMQDIPRVFDNIDLLWSEGAAYNIGFSNALSTWATAIRPGGFLVVSELSWLSEQAPEPVQAFFLSAYPAMSSIQQNLAAAEDAGYRVLTTYTLSREAWVDGYYAVLEPRAKALSGHTDADVRAFAAEMLREIDVFRSSADSYGYVFYILQRA